MTSADNRAVVSDDNQTIRLKVYSMRAAARVEVDLPPLVALRLAGDLLHAAAAHLARETPP